MEFCTGFLFYREYSRRRPGPFPLFHARDREFDAREREFSSFTPCYTRFILLMFLIS
jgi:hypothetical protein